MTDDTPLPCDLPSVRRKNDFGRVIREANIKAE
jgi:hypothetical protein